MIIEAGNGIDDDAIITFDDPEDRSRDSVWLTVKLGDDRPNVSLLLIRRNEGLEISAYPYGREMEAAFGTMHLDDTDLKDAELTTD